MSETLRTPVTFLAVLFAGLVAGLLLGTAVDHQQLSVLDAANWTLARQSIDSVFSRVLPWVWNGTLILLLVAGFLNRGASRWLFLGAGVLLFLGIVMTVSIEVPINKQIASWTPGTIPAHWTELRARWLTFHDARTGMGILAFICGLVGLVKK